MSSLLISVGPDGGGRVLMRARPPALRREVLPARRIGLYVEEVFLFSLAASSALLAAIAYLA